MRERPTLSALPCPHLAALRRHARWLASLHPPAARRVLAATRFAVGVYVERRRLRSGAVVLARDYLGHAEDHTYPLGHPGDLAVYGGYPDRYAVVRSWQPAVEAYGLRRVVGWLKSELRMALEAEE